jgi:cell division protein FtsB
MQRGNQWVRWLWLALVLYMMYTVGRLSYKNYQLNMEEAGLRSDVSSLENEIQDLKNKLVYYQSDSYKEKMLRAKLNLQKEGEKVVVITPEPKVEEVQERKTNNLSNPEKWWQYFFGSQG